MDNSKIFLTPGFLLLGGMEGVPPPTGLKFAHLLPGKIPPSIQGFPSGLDLWGTFWAKWPKTA